MITLNWTRQEIMDLNACNIDEMAHNNKKNPIKKVVLQKLGSLKMANHFGLIFYIIKSILKVSKFDKESISLPEET